MGKTYALTGNPNSGKTTIFNELTGSTQYVGNWSGVTVEKKEGIIKNTDIKVVDLPGIYSMSSTSIDEIIAMEYISEEHPDGIINVVSASNLERNLYLTVQLLEMNVPVTVILNMMDEVKRRGMNFDVAKFQEIFKVPVIPTGAHDRKNVEKVKDVVILDEASTFARFSYFNEEIRKAIEEIQKIIVEEGATHDRDPRWMAMKILEGNNNIKTELEKTHKSIVGAGNQLAKAVEEKYGKSLIQLLAEQRYAFLNKVTRQIIQNQETEINKETWTDKLDRVLTHRILSIPIFFGIMWFIYYVTITGLGDYTIRFMEWLVGDLITGSVTWLLQWMGTSALVESLVVDGIIGGVGAVLVFVPQIMILFFFISIMEDSGYMARIAFLMDRIFKRFGLSGKSIIPMLVGSGCSVPGIMATRTLENERDRKLTIILTPFISCGAKLPVYLLFSVAFFPKNSHWVVFSLYVMGVVVAMMSGLLLSKLRYKGEESDFLLEMPPYRVPVVKSVVIHTWEKAKEFLVRAGTVIFAASVILWFAQSFNGRLQFVHADQSLLAGFGRIIAPIFAPLGFGDWITSVAFITGFAAKEMVISTLSVLHGVGETGLITSLQSVYTPLAAYSFLVFILLASPCFASISVMRKELNSWKETGFAILYQTGTAYLISMLIYQTGRLLF
ncbi:ferrous iron transport protein B [Alkalibacter rhizosphaerae]|uniref:Ferrous iron transport protein B n=1 Tax=Alkalibacter rhizosphaerae TaxID=2815577 RepID=A0A975AHX5_9FIRM|nr:ferrous iron transport protein B [Alkalibacter rhizosphaerae]QSX09064.1 ferrous iron transport protein B [Alkalibacter rhizosphaerae]